MTSKCQSSVEYDDDGSLTTLAYDSAAAQHVLGHGVGINRAYPWDGTREITEVPRFFICLLWEKAI